MNWIKRNVTLIALIAALVALNAFGVWLLLGAIDNEAKAREIYEANLEKRAKLTTPPTGKREIPWFFPSAENRGLLEENEKILRDLAAAMTEQLKQHGQEYPPMRASDFQGLANTTVGRLIELAKKSGTQVPPNFYFGFHYYYNGMFPFEANTPRLQQQLAAVETISKILFESRVPFWEELLLIEPPGETTIKQNPALGIAAPVVPEVLPLMTILRRSETGFQYDMIPFSIIIQCPTETLRAVLNRFAAEPKFYVVTRLEPLISVRTEQEVDVPPQVTMPPTKFVYGEQHVRTKLIIYLRGVPPITEPPPPADPNQPNP